ncbi:MAG: hypothetical protein ACRD4R_15735 [Candidatus Acidiferrales bacterium]
MDEDSAVLAGVTGNAGGEEAPTASPRVERATISPSISLKTNNVRLEIHPLPQEVGQFVVTQAG